MENWFSLSPCSICFHVHQAFASNLLLQGSPVVLVCPPQNRIARRVPAVESLNTVLHKLWTRPLFRLVYCIEAISAARAQPEPEGHKKLSAQHSLCANPPALRHCSFSTKATHIFAGFWLLCIKIVKRLSQGREMGRECIEPGKVMAYSLWLS